MATATETKTTSATSKRKDRSNASDHRKNSSSGTPSLGRKFYLQPGKEIEVDAIAKMFRQVAGHEDRLKEDLEANGQLRPVIVVKGQNGKKTMKDGNTRTKILHTMDPPRPVKCIEYSKAEWAQILDGKDKSEYLFAENFSGSQGRQLSDDQRAITVIDFFPNAKQQSEKNSKQVSPCAPID